MNKSAETDTAAAVAPTDASSDTTSASPVPEGTPVNQPYGGAHPGIDLGVPLDTRISSAIAGKVTVLSVNGDAGLQIGVQGPDGTLTLYDHMHSADVALGSTVKAGQPIGTSGGEAGGATSGNSTGAHLHFEVRDASGQTVDPTPWLAGGHPIVGAAPADITTVVDPVAAQGANLLDIARGQHPTDSGQTKTTPGAKATGTGSTDDADPGAIDSFLAAIRQKESNNNYQVRNTSGLSNAAGAYQFIGTTWQGLGGSTASAADASPAEQDAIARAYAMQLFNTYHSWRLAAIAWYQPSAARDASSTTGIPSLR
jgi:hypothetical protein